MTSYESQYRNEIIKMMYVAGHTTEPSVETTSLVENIVRDETTKIVAAAGDLASHRGQAKFTVNDLLFQVRHDGNCLARLRHLMRWSRLRKQVKEKENDNAIDNPEPEELNELIEAVDEEEDNDSAEDHPAETASGSKHIALAKGAPSVPPLPWSTPVSFFPQTILSDIPSITSLSTEEDSESERTGLLHNLERDDLCTRDMTAEEYNTQWSSARSASFTHKQKTRFRAWCGLGSVADHTAKDDVCVQILGALAREWVQNLTERAMAVAAAAQQEERCLAKTKVGARKRKLEGPCAFAEDTERKVQGDVQIEPLHVRRAFELLAMALRGYTGMSNGTCLGQRKRRRMF